MTHLHCLRNGSIPSEMQLYGYSVYTYSLGIDSLPGKNLHLCWVRDRSIPSEKQLQFHSDDTYSCGIDS